MNKKNYFISLLLFAAFLFTRLLVRLSNNLWADELAEINALKNIPYLLTVYLRGITAGYPGHYLFMYPLVQLFGPNRLFLGLPGLISQAFVFFYLPQIIRILKVIPQRHNFFATTIARLLFLLDPKLTFQAIEVRPYSVMPLLWTVIVFLLTYLMSLDGRKLLVKQKIKFILAYLLLLLLFYFHSVSAIMAISIFVFFILSKKEYAIKQIISRRSLILLSLAIVLSLPVWNYFSVSKCTFCYVNRFDTFKTAVVSIMEMYAINKGGFNYIKIQNIAYFISLCIILFLVISEMFIFMKNLLIKKSIRTNSFFTINLALVLLPLAIIFISDYMNNYGFWLRQFAWVMLPFYISIGLLVWRIFNRLSPNVKQSAK